MKALLIVIGLGFGLASSTSFADAKKPVKAHASKSARRTRKSVRAKAPPKSELSTDVKFDDSVLHGQYQTPDEALVKVENEKGLNDLIGVRKHFKDRLQTASEQE